MNKKQLKNVRVNVLLIALLCDTLSDEEAKKVNQGNIRSLFPNSTHYKDQSTGEIRVGLSIKGVTKLVKKYPDVTLEGAKAYFGIA